MACLEHKCRRCEWEDSSNVPVKKCPECGTFDVANISDEAHDDFTVEEDDEHLDEQE